MRQAAAKRATTSQQTLTARDVKHFLSQYKKAWETHNPDLVANLFTRDAQYKQDPFGEAIVGREAIHHYWAGATGRQEDIHFTIGAFIQSGYILAAEWKCTYQDPGGERKELAGMFLADFYGKQVRRFREYWHSRKIR